MKEFYLLYTKSQNFPMMFSELQEGIGQFWDTLRLLQQLVESVSCNG